ncbi:MAG: DUF1499 domain-containing protein [Syntrophobacteraceae bacterium]|nr:DUF1499 domain-containing protein [Syntrophobacteraceae bacterium]
MEPIRLLISACLMAVCWSALNPAAVQSTASPPDGSRLLPCPDSPNCVSSRSEQGGRAIAPLVIQGSSGEAMECLKRVIMAMKRTRIVSSDAQSIEAEFRTRLGFVDDVSFELDAGAAVIQMRSASRVGYWDLGENRRRLEKVRQLMIHHCQQRAV